MFSFDYPEFVENEAIENTRENLVVRTLGLGNKGPYGNSIFGLPSLAILGKGGISIDNYVAAFPQEKVPYGEGLNFSSKQMLCFYKKKVVIPKMYELLIRSKVNLGEAEVLALDGQVDVTAAKGFADYAIDIIDTGFTVRKEGLGIFPPLLYQSDGVILGNIKAKSEMKLNADKFWEVVQYGKI